MSLTVDASDGQRWKVRRRWPGDRGLKVVDGCARLRRRVTAGLTRASRAASWEARSAPSAPVGNATVEVVANPAGCNAIGVGLVALVGLLVLLVVDALVRIVVMPIALVAHLAFRRPWLVEATTEWSEPVHRQVVGWSESRRAVDTLAADLRAGTASDAKPGPQIS